MHQRFMTLHILLVSQDNNLRDSRSLFNGFPQRFVSDTKDSFEAHCHITQYEL